MCRVVGPMAAMGGMGVMWCSFAMRLSGISLPLGGASTFGLGVGSMGKGRTGMGHGGRIG